MDRRLRHYVGEWEPPDPNRTPPISLDQIGSVCRWEHLATLSDEQISQHVQRYIGIMLLISGRRGPSCRPRWGCDKIVGRCWTDLYFVCAITGEPVQALYPTEVGWVSGKVLGSPRGRAALRKVYVRGELLRQLKRPGHPFSTEIRDLMLSELRALGPIEDEQVARLAQRLQANTVKSKNRRELLAGRAQRREQRQARRQAESEALKLRQESDALGTWALLRRAEAAGHQASWAQVDGLSVAPNAKVRRIDVAARLDAPLASLEDHLHLDLRVLKREGRYWRRSAVTLIALMEGVLISLDLQRTATPYMRLAFSVDGEAVLQTFELTLETIGQRLRPRFICPLEGQVEVIALRQGRFASVKAQRLLYPSEARRRAKWAPKSAPNDGEKGPEDRV